LVSEKIFIFGFRKKARDGYIMVVRENFREGYWEGDIRSNKRNGSHEGIWEVSERGNRGSSESASEAYLVSGCEPRQGTE